MKQLTCIFIYAMLMKILKDKERVFSKQLFWITPFGVKAIRTAGSTADRRRKLPLLIELLRDNNETGFKPYVGSRAAALLF